MMVLLTRDVVLEGLNMRRANGKRTVTLLPTKIGELRLHLLDPFGRITLQIADKVGDGVPTA